MKDLGNLIFFLSLVVFFVALGFKEKILGIAMIPFIILGAVIMYKSARPPRQK